MKYGMVRGAAPPQKSHCAKSAESAASGGQLHFREVRWFLIFPNWPATERYGLPQMPLCVKHWRAKAVRKRQFHGTAELQTRFMKRRTCPQVAAEGGTPPPARQQRLKICQRVVTPSAAAAQIPVIIHCTSFENWFRGVHQPRSSS
jgi:hypothetical protein